MKRILFLLILFAHCALGQTPDTISLDELKAPSSPAFILLDLQPSAISRPTTVKDFEVNLPSLVGEDGFLKRNLALEINPYGIYSNKTISYQEYLDQNKPLKNIIRNGTISFATTDKDSILKGTLAGFGARTIIFNGRSPEKLTNYKNALNSLQTLHAISAAVSQLELMGTTILKDKARIKQELVNNFTILKNDKSLNLETLNYQEEELKALIDNSTTSPGEILKQLTQAANPVESLMNAAKAVEEAGKDRYGFLLEAAYSLAIQFPFNTWDNGRIPRQGAWITAGYRSETIFGLKGTSDILGVARYMWNDFPGNQGTESNFDLGVKLALEWDKLSLEGEALFRFNQSIPTELKDIIDDRNERITGTVSYQLSKNFLLTYTLGKDFDFSFLNERGDVISTVGLTVATGFQQVKLR